MKRKKLIILSSVLAITSGVLVTALASNKEVLNTNGLEDTYTLRITKETLCSLPEGDSNFYVETNPLHNKIDFKVKNGTNKSYNQCFWLGANGEISNPYIKDKDFNNAISGIKSITLGGPSFYDYSIRYGYKTDVSDGNYMYCKDALYCSKEFNFNNTLPTYFKIINNKNFKEQLDYIDITYSCNETKVDNYYHNCLLELNEDKQSYKITKYLGNKAVVDIPTSFKGLPVNTIAHNAFENNNDIRFFDIPESITTIENYAFFNADNLSIIKLPKNLTMIDTAVFSNAGSLKAIYIPKSVTGKGYFPFTSCRDLEYVYYEGTEEEYQKLDNPSSKLFDYYTHKVIYNALDTNFKYFDDANYEYVTINDKDVIPLRCHKTLATNINVEEDFKNLNVIAFGTGCFEEMENLVNFEVFPKDVFKISKNCFYHCEKLITVNISSNIRYIGDGAFCYCEYIAYMKLPENLESIGSNAFGTCQRLTYVYLPKSLKNFGPYCFDLCTAIINIFYEGTMEEYNKIEGKDKEVGQFNVTCEAPNTMSMALENNGVTSYVTNSINNKISIYEFLDDTVKDLDFNIGYDGLDIVSLGFMPFLEHGYKLNSIKLNDNCLHLSSFSLSKCESLTSLILPEGITELPIGAFNHDYVLENVKIPSSVKAIRTYAFDSCTSMKEIRIPMGVELIEKRTFSYCNSLTDLYIPSSVVTIEGDLFVYDTKNVTIHTDLASKPAGWADDYLGDATNTIIFNENL